MGLSEVRKWCKTGRVDTGLANTAQGVSPLLISRYYPTEVNKYYY